MKDLLIRKLIFNIPKASTIDSSIVYSASRLLGHLIVERFKILVKKSSVIAVQSTAYIGSLCPKRAKAELSILSSKLSKILFAKGKLRPETGTT